VIMEFVLRAAKGRDRSPSGPAGKGGSRPRVLHRVGARLVRGFSRRARTSRAPTKIARRVGEERRDADGRLGEASLP
jgi:hypothetical protein